MSLAPVRELNHFVKDLFQEGATPLETLQSKIYWLETKSFAYSALEKICYVALLAIIGTVLAISYTSAALGSMASLGVVAIALATPLVAHAAAKINLLIKQIGKELKFEEGVYRHLEEIKDWGAHDILTHLQAQGIDPENLELEPLRSIYPNEPEKALLPIIARYRYLREKVTSSYLYHTQASQRCEETLRGSGQMPPAAYQTIRFATYEMAMHQCENEAVPAAIFAATLLHIIVHPTIDLDYKQETREIPGIGYCAPRAFSRRIFGRNFEPINDDYFVFSQREAITLGQVEARGLDSNQIRHLLFPV